MHRSSKPQQPKFAHYSHIKNWISSPIKELHVPERLQSAIKFFKELNTCTGMNGCVEHDRVDGEKRQTRSETKLCRRNPHREWDFSLPWNIWINFPSKDIFERQIYAKQMFGTRKVAAGRTRPEPGVMQMYSKMCRHVKVPSMMMMSRSSTDFCTASRRALSEKFYFAFPSRRRPSRTHLNHNWEL